jgi:hypothetical protein
VALKIVGADGDAAPLIWKKFSAGLLSPPPKNFRQDMNIDPGRGFPFNKKMAGPCPFRFTRTVFHRL